jgi:hypothetical protein
MLTRNPPTAYSLSPLRPIDHRRLTKQECNAGQAPPVGRSGWLSCYLRANRSRESSVARPCPRRKRPHRPCIPGCRRGAAVTIVGFIGPLRLRALACPRGAWTGNDGGFALIRWECTENSIIAGQAQRGPQVAGFSRVPHRDHRAAPSCLVGVRGTLSSYRSPRQLLRPAVKVDEQRATNPRRRARETRRTYEGCVAVRLAGSILVCEPSSRSTSRHWPTMMVTRRTDHHCRDLRAQPGHAGRHATRSDG